MTDHVTPDVAPLAEYQNGIYMAGAGGARPDLPITPDAMEARAREVLDAEAFGYVAGSAGSEDTMRANREAFRRWRIVPRMLVDVQHRDLSVDMLGARLPAPLLLAPIGVQGILHADGELAVARAAAAAEVPLILSGVSSFTIEEVAAANGAGRRWYQLYWPRDRDVARSFVARAEAAGYGAIVVTLDTRMLAWRPRDLANGYLPFLRAAGLASYLSDPAFRAELPVPPEQDIRPAVARFLAIFSDPSVTWSDLTFLRDSTRLPLVLKGILRPDDARRAIDHGADAIVVSNHGGRQVDGAIAALDALPDVVEAVGGVVPVLFDSGIRTGADAFKAIALGARAVLLGRPYAWGLAVGGQRGVEHVLRGPAVPLRAGARRETVAGVSSYSRATLTDDHPNATPPRPKAMQSSAPRPPSPARAALAGLVAAAVGMGTGELVGGLVPGATSPVVAIGSLVIALQPPGAKDLMTTLFGSADKTALGVAVVAVGLLVGALAGVLGRHAFGPAWRLLAGVGGLALVAALLQPLDQALPALLDVALATGAGILSLRLLLAWAGCLPPLGTGGPWSGESREPRETVPAGGLPDPGRRRFLLGAGGLLGLALVGGSLGRWLLERGHPAGGPVAAVLPVPAEVVPALGAGASLAAPGITPLVVAADRFYRIDTELLVPQVDAASWSLRVDGMVDHPLVFTYAELLALPLFEQYVTIACVSNAVGGNLVGNARWTGVHLKAILAEAGVQAGASQVVGRAVDGFTVGFPTAWALDPAREPMIALGMNGAPLSPEHGYPARLIVPGLYGYVSATKWLAEIELTTLEAFDAYWVRLGWAKEGPILTQSRIDHPSAGASLPAGPVIIDGLAWAPDRGIARVEVRIDGGAWQAAQLGRALSRATWVQWLVPWQATRGDHVLEVRATDGTGAVQTATPGGPAPAGATGYDRVAVSVH
jgi:lactate 2-monooxygenase